MRCEVYKPTNDNWCGSYKVEGGKLLVHVGFYNLSEEGFAVHVSGNDDLCISKFFEASEEKKAWCAFLEVIGLEYVDMTPLHKLGFVSN